MPGVRSIIYIILILSRDLLIYSRICSYTHIIIGLPHKVSTFVINIYLFIFVILLLVVSECVSLVARCNSVPYTVDISSSEVWLLGVVERFFLLLYINIICSSIHCSRAKSINKKQLDNTTMCQFEHWSLFLSAFLYSSMVCPIQFISRVLTIRFL